MDSDLVRILLVDDDEEDFRLTRDLLVGDRGHGIQTRMGA
jgi:hypothetical protein